MGVAASPLASKIRAANIALIEKGDVDAIARFFAPTYIAHLTDSDLTGGHTALRKVMALYRSAFAALRVEVKVLIKSDDRVAWQRTLRGTHRGAFRGFPATGRRVVWREMLISRFRNGLIAEEWVVSDLAERLLLARHRKS
jgi:steroid delta-isomerase-like uncharacterized protein